MSVATADAQDQFARRPREELAAMCVLRGLPVNETDAAPHLRRLLRNDVAERRRDDPGTRIVAPTADRDTAARMALIDGEVRDHFAAAPAATTARAVARALRRNEQEVLLALQRLACPRQANGLYAPPPTSTQEPN